MSCEVSLNQITCLFSCGLPFLEQSLQIGDGYGQVFIIHYADVIMIEMASQITSLMITTQTLIRAQIKVNIKAPRHWPLCGEFTGTGEFPAQRASNAENVSI